eukprot:2918660-Amphidinium_carterae.1
MFNYSICTSQCIVNEALLCCHFGSIPKRPLASVAAQKRAFIQKRRKAKRAEFYCEKFVRFRPVVVARAWLSRPLPRIVD